MNMTFEQVLTFLTDSQIQRILKNDSLTDFQKAANVHAILSASAPPPKAERKAPKPMPKPRDDLATHGQQSEIE